MKKAVIILISLLLICFGIYKHIQNQKIKAEQKQARAEKQLKNIDFHNYPVKNDVQKIPKNVSFKTINAETKSSSAPKRNIIGDKIPDWVYENTSSNDRYYSLIHSKTNFVYSVYADCHIGKGRKQAINNAVIQTGISNKFLNKMELKPNGSSEYISCSQNTTQCAVFYLYDNCHEQFCIINPAQKRIVFVKPEEKALTVELNELKNNW
jgi:hypothetical protein